MVKKFKLTWNERVADEEGYTLYFEDKSQIIEALDGDAACAQWEKENEYNDCQNGLDDCFEVIESDLFKKHMLIDMPDGLTYGISVEVIARNRAEYYAHKEYGGDIGESLRDDTLPLFEDEYQIRDWAANNMNWSDVKRDAMVLKKKVDESEFQEQWVNGEYKIK